MFEMQDDVSRLWAIRNKCAAEMRRLESRVSSQESYYYASLKNRKRARRRKRQSDYKVHYLIAEKRKKILKSEEARYKRSIKKLARAQANLDNYIYEKSGIEGYEDNFLVMFSARKNMIDIYFGGRGCPDGPGHGHCGLRPKNLRVLFMRYPGEPHPVKIKSKRSHDDDSFSLIVCGRLRVFAPAN